MNLNEASLEKKLNSCVNTQDSIQSLSLWVLHHKNYHKRIVQLWLKALEKGKVSHRLTLFYLANDVVQHAKKKNIPGYLGDFEEILRDAIQLVRDEKIRPNINRVLNIWQERNIYPVEFVDELRELLTGSSVKVSSASKIVAEFKLSQLVEKMKRARKIEAARQQKVESVNSSRIDALSKEVLNNLKDKSHGEQYSKDFDDATKLIESLVSTLEKEIAIRNDLIEYLEKSEIFYETQKGEAKIVASAYKNFAQRVKSVKKKLSESKTSLPSPLPSPNADAPSPTNSDDGPQLPAMEATNGQPISSLDKRLSNLMQGMPLVSNRSTVQPIKPSYTHPAPVTLPPALQAAIGINPALASSLDWVLGIQQPPPPPPPPPPPLIPNVGAAIMSQDLYQTYDYDYFSQINPAVVATMVPTDLYKVEQSETVQPIQAVVSSRTDSELTVAEPFKPIVPVQTVQYENYLTSGQQVHENFEPSDMELGNSDDEEPVSRLQSQRFLKVIETQNAECVGDDHLYPGPSMGQLTGPESLNQIANNSSLSPVSPHKQYGPRQQGNNRSRLVTPSRHHHAPRDVRGMEPRWMSPVRPNSQYTGHPPNSYHTGPSRHWKTPQHGSRGSFNRRY